MLFRAALAGSRLAALAAPTMPRRGFTTTITSANKLTPRALISVLDEMTLKLSAPTKELEETAKTITNDAKRQQFVFDEVIKVQHDLWVKHGVDPKLGFELLHSEEGWDQVESLQKQEEGEGQGERDVLVKRLMEFDMLEEKLVMTLAHGEEEYKNQFERRLIIQEIFADLNQLATEEEKQALLEGAITSAQALFKDKLGGFTEDEIEQKFESVLSFDEQRLIMRGQLCREIQDSANSEDDEDGEGEGHGHSHGGVPCHGHSHHHHEEEQEAIPRDGDGKPVWKKSNQ